jgi:hypothetical protein
LQPDDTSNCTENEVQDSAAMMDAGAIAEQVLLLYRQPSPQINSALAE